MNRVLSTTGQRHFIVLGSLDRKSETIAPHLETQIQSLSLTHLEDLGEALLDFETVADLEAWLKQHP